MQVSGTTKQRIQEYIQKDLFITTDQPLGDLAMVLLEPLSKDFFRWGFFFFHLSGTEYIESYVWNLYDQNATRVT
jgi:hypothetical protein